jgi:hypothetical protein
MHRHECNTHNFLFNLEIKQGFFSYAIFPVKKNKYWKYFKIMRKLLFNYSLYSHLEIGKFQGVTSGAHPFPIFIYLVTLLSIKEIQ